MTPTPRLTLTPDELAQAIAIGQLRAQGHDATAGVLTLWLADSLIHQSSP